MNKTMKSCLITLISIVLLSLLLHGTALAGEIEIVDAETPAAEAIANAEPTAERAEQPGDSQAFAAPGAPGKPKATVNNNTLTIKWSKVSGAVGYQIYRTNPDTGKYEKQKNTKSVSYKDTGLRTSTVYKYKVRAYTKENGKTVYGKFSPAVQARTGVDSPAEITRVGIRYINYNRLANGLISSATIGWEIESNGDGNFNMAEKLSTTDAAYALRYKFDQTNSIFTSSKYIGFTTVYCVHLGGGITYAPTTYTISCGGKTASASLNMRAGSFESGGSFYTSSV